MGRSSELMFTWALMADLKDLVLSCSSILMTREMPSSNSMASNGKAVPSRFEKIGLLTRAVVVSAVAAVDLVGVEASAEVLVVEEGLEEVAAAVAGLVEVLVGVEDMVEAAVGPAVLVLPADLMLVILQLLPRMPSPTTPRPAQTRLRSFTCAM